MKILYVAAFAAAALSAAAVNATPSPNFATGSIGTSGADRAVTTNDAPAAKFQLEARRGRGRDNSTTDDRGPGRGRGGSGEHPPGHP